MQRRELIRLVSGASIAAVGQPGVAFPKTRTKANWRSLEERLGSRLITVCSPLKECARSGGQGADALFAKCKNPYFLGDEPGLTQTFGWTDAWTSRASDRAILAETSSDVAATVDFARREGVRLVIKGGGHSYFGNSNAANSLLVWTKRMRSISLHDDFVGQGCPKNAEPVPAVSVGAGALWGQVYQAVTVEGGRYVQGGGCLTVGVAGFVQGGGFGSLSKQFGTGAANLLEAEVVTADGQVRLVNACRHPDLFFALKGGGGGTFGVVTRLTMRTHAVPSTIGAVLFSVRAQSPSAWRALVARIMAFYGDALFNPIWGEQLTFSPSMTLTVSMLFHGLDEGQARATWQPFMAWLEANAADYLVRQKPVFLAVPARQFWNSDFLRKLPGIVKTDDRPDAPSSNIYWATNEEEAGQVLHAYQSAWIPAGLLQPSKREQLVDALVAGSAEWTMTLHTNKGLAGGSPKALALASDTATNPAMLESFALLICAAQGPAAWPGIPGHSPDLADGRREAAGVARAIKPIRRLVPDAGVYVSEADYHDTDWQRRYWGRHYPALLATKRRWDPNSIFFGRHTVGSA